MDNQERNPTCPTAWGTTGQLVSTESLAGTFETGTSTGLQTMTTTGNNTGKSWLVNAYTNYQVRITGGTGIGQNPHHRQQHCNCADGICSVDCDARRDQRLRR